jgi:NAD(P)-dependent dehydrogenase (short-subunit alcohol dehydrogenase family)
MGFATATLLASRGAIISLADINEEAAKSATKSLPESHKHMYTAVDVRSHKSVDSWIEHTLQKLGKLDGAVNMAGIIRPAKPITESTEDDWDFTFAVNARGVFNCLGAELKAMSPGGSIVSRLPFCSRECSVLTCCPFQ